MPDSAIRKLSFGPCCFAACVLFTWIALPGGLRTSQVPRHILLGSLASMTPAKDALPAFYSKAPIACWTHQPIRFRNTGNFEATSVHPTFFGFRLADFALYASLIRLPYITQDSLHSGAGAPSVTGLSPAKCVRLLGARCVCPALLSALSPLPCLLYYHDLDCFGFVNS